MEQNIQKIIIVGGGTAGWMTASYLIKNLGANIDITLIESQEIKKIGVGEATIPNFQKVFFDGIGVTENEWMAKCNGSFKAGIKFKGWNNPFDGNDYFYHLFGQIADIDGISLTHFWDYFRKTGKTTNPLIYDCFDQALSLDDKRSPRQLNGEHKIHYAWHFDANDIVEYLKELSCLWGVKHVDDFVQYAILNANGSIKSIITKNYGEMTADLYIDCSGFRKLLINEAMKVPFIDMSDRLLCNSAIAASIPHDDKTFGIEPYTSALAMKNGWTWKIPLLGRFGTGYVYSNSFITEDEAVNSLFKLWNIKENDISLNMIHFKTGRNSESWVKNCVSIGLSSCFLEPLESTGIYFIYASIYQLVKHLPDKIMGEKNRDSFNKKIRLMYDDCFDFVQSHYILSSREDSDFWKTNKYDLNISDSLKEKIATYKAGLTVCKPPTTNDLEYYNNFELEFDQFWTNSNYTCIFSGLKLYPEHINNKVLYGNRIEKAELKFKSLKLQGRKLLKTLPTTFEYLQYIHNNTSGSFT